MRFVKSIAEDLRRTAELLEDHDEEVMDCTNDLQSELSDARARITELETERDAALDRVRGLEQGLPAMLQGACDKCIIDAMRMMVKENPRLGEIPSVKRLLEGAK